jgi:hypothetical protein
MANLHIQGDVYLKVIEDVIAGSKEEFEHAGVGQGTLGELQQVSAIDCPSSVRQPAIDQSSSLFLLFRSTLCFVFPFHRKRKPSTF